MRPATPLCPAGHLPLKGGDQLSFAISPISGRAKFMLSLKPTISPPEGEMPGRAEGGA
ncbi:MAG: lytic murein transglycosylase [Mesorhizobium sp.]|nr:MAG: lytic murein transglycosylase [Mesorhizobium sp.]